MKKRILTVLLVCLSAIMCFTGCGLGTYIDNGTNKTPSDSAGSTPSKPTDPDEPTINPDDPNQGTPVTSENDYTVSVFYRNRLFNPGDKVITVVWHSDYDEPVRVTLGADGRANAGELDGEYSVYLEGLTGNYTYNPNSKDYKAGPNSREVSIQLLDITQPASGAGDGLWSAAKLNREGTYRAVITKGTDGEPKEYFCDYTPSKAGWYIIESWVNVYANEVNPIYGAYIGSAFFKMFDKWIDDGSVSGSYTKNFKYDYKVDASGVGNSFPFSIKAEHYRGEYPIYVDFQIKYYQNYSDGSSNLKDMHASQIPPKAQDKKSNEDLYWADVENKLFDEDNFKLNPATNLYHRYDEVKYADDPYGYGAGYGPLLMCAIKRTVPSYTCGYSLYFANDVGGEMHVNKLKISKVWVPELDKDGNPVLDEYGNEKGEYTSLDYQYFIRDDYGPTCNSDGFCYVTQELKEFLDMYATQESLWTDGAFDMSAVDILTPEYNNYKAKKDSFWLFACAFYE
ncbi:MAG: hypothetical protein HDQ88_10910 [Clostridia bacterium]|nr:hypothetical protein [Clostridia bacterium]